MAAHDARLCFVRTSAGFAPAEKRAQDWLEKIKIGQELLLDPPKRTRSGPFHRLYWALVAKVWENLDERRAELYPTIDDLHEALKIAAGLRTRLEMPDGTIAYRAGSIAFDKMGADEFRAFYDRVCDLVSKHFLPNVSSETLKAEVETMIGLRAA